MLKKPKKMNLFEKLFDYKMWFYDFLKLTAVVPVLVDLRLKRVFVSGKKPRGLLLGKYIVSSNHTSYVDPVILSNAFWNRRIGFVATSELFNTKFKNFMFKSFGCIKINKANPSMQTFKEVKERLDRGHIVGVFPEGTVASGENMNVFKSGIVMMAVMSEAPILPVFIVRRKNRWHRQIVVIGEKIDYKDFVKGPFPTMDELDEITKYLATKEHELECKFAEKTGRK